jgi:hypothetical protein
MSKPLTLDEARAVPLEAVQAAVGEPYETWSARCHEMALKVLQTGLYGPGRIARGFAAGIPGQHSWIVLGGVYDPLAVIADPTLRLWLGTEPPGIQVLRNEGIAHRPHGSGSCFNAGMPCSWGGEEIELASRGLLSEEAAEFLDDLGPLDARGWMEVASLPVEDWPAAEIIQAMYETPSLKAFIPIDIVGHLTDHNPGGLYW